MMIWKKEEGQIGPPTYPTVELAPTQYALQLY